MEACPDLELLEPYAAETLEGRRFSRLHAHVSSCASCRATLTELERNLALAESLRRLGARRAQAPEPVHAPDGYRLLRELGRGGMGTVFEALQERTGRRVALKLLHRGGLLHGERELGFRRELRALSRLRHPNLAAVLDAGHAPDGRPFLVLELVEGQTLERHLAESGASRARRVELLEILARALAGAHQRGVIHRDLKPSNVIVDAEGRPKILDFGLARLLELEEDEPALDSLVTRSTRVQGSLPYMSPEQVRADPDGVDLRSDVYALGVLGYEMLLGRLPYDAPWRRIAAAARVIAEEPPLAPRALAPRFPRDLARILLKALEKEPAERYGSALELAEDLARFRQGLPVLAQPPSLGYQLAKLVRRHRAASALAGALVLGVLGSALALGALYARAEGLRRTAEAERELALARGAELEAALGWLDGMIVAVDPLRAQGAEVRLLEVLEESQAELERGRLAARPPVEAAVRRSLGSSWLALGRLEEAERDLERALLLREAQAPPDPAALAAVCSDLGRLRLQQGRHEEACALHELALARLEGLDPRQDERPIQVRADLAAALREAGRLDEAEAELARALETLGPAPGRRALRAVLLAERANVLELRGRWADSASERRAVLELRRELFGEEHIQTAFARHNLAGSLARSGGDPREVSELQERSLATMRERLPPDHPTTRTALMLAATLRADRGELAEAERLYGEALEGLRALHGDEHPLVGRILHNLGFCQLVAGRVADGVRSIEEALAILERTLPAEHAQIVEAQARLAAGRAAQGRLEEALELLRLVRARASVDPGLRQIDSASSVFEARIEAARGARGRAAELLAELVERERAAGVASGDELAVYLQFEAEHRLAAGEPRVAASRSKEAHALRRAARGARDPKTLGALEHWVAAALAAGDTREVRRALEEVLAEPGVDSEPRLRIALGRCLLAEGLLDEGEHALERARALLVPSEPPSAEERLVLEALAELCALRGDSAGHAGYLELLGRGAAPSADPARGE